MHRYLKAIGFSQAFSSQKEIDDFLDEIYQTCDQRAAFREPDGGRAFMEVSRSFGPGIGIRVCGELDGSGFHRQYYYPYLQGAGVTTEEEVTVEMLASGGGYAGMCDDGRVGISLIYYVQNPVDYRRFSHSGQIRVPLKSTTFSALSLDGMILLPGKKPEKGNKAERKEYYTHHDSLVSAAKNGSQEAIESLTVEDMDTYAMLSRRIQNEDILTIIDTYFMPFGLECDQYQIMGEIQFYAKVQNTRTRENLYQMTVDCNGLLFDLCINEKDLLGVPEVGRRFKGNIWLQGKLNISGPTQII